MFESALKRLIDAVEGASGAALLATEGWIIEALDAQGRKLDADEVLSEYAGVFEQLATLDEVLNLGQIDQFEVQTDHHLVSVRVLTPHYLLAVRAPKDAIPGKVAFQLRIVSPDITREL